MVSNGIQGRITQGLAPGTIVRKTLQFVQSQLPRWRDMPDRPAVSAEEELNGQLCKYLNVAARREDFPMAYFHHEERQTERSRVDLSAMPLDLIVIEGRSYGILEPFLVLEGKRLPTPGSNREREYVIGVDKPTGGIQRFKLGLHGAKLAYGGMIGYVQEKSFIHWFTCINDWIEGLANSDDWSHEDRLVELDTDAASRVGSCWSSHVRCNSVTPEVHLTHLWVDMT